MFASRARSASVTPSAERSRSSRPERTLRPRLGPALVAISLVGSLSVGVAFVATQGALAASKQKATPGGGAAPSSSAARSTAAPAASSPTALSPFVSENCQCSLSVDAIGTNNAAGAPIQVQKNAGATVKEAFLFAVGTGQTGYTPVDGDVTLNGTAISWDPAQTITNNIGSGNVEANVTAIVKPIVDTAAAGLVPITVAEPLNTTSVDGELLAVVLNDPSAPANNGIILMYGAQTTAGDTFNINLASPLDLTQPDLSATMGIGDSFGYQPAGQYSTMMVNGTLMSSSAGGQDDCVAKYDPTPVFGSCANGSLITAGGVGDSTSNPSDPSATDQTCGPPAAPRCDDELYNLLPFVKTGDSSIAVSTQNPSNNDNIFFASLDLTATTAIVGEGILLTPASATSVIGAPHTVTAKVVDSSGGPVANQTVSFNVTSGPNAGLAGTGTTDANGEATFTYTSTAVGTDSIQASFTNANAQTFTSSPVTEAWTTSPQNATTLTYTGDTSAVNGQPVTLSGLLTTDNPSAGTPLSGKTVTFTLGTGGTAQTCTATTDVSGAASCTVAVVNQTVGSVPVTATFAGDTDNQPADASSSVVVSDSGPVAKPTQITTSLSGGHDDGRHHHRHHHHYDGDVGSRGTISVPLGTAVTDSARLTGDNAATATGTVMYNVYSDSSCTTAVSGGPEDITTAGVMPDSAPVTLAEPGTYYWQATYSGDATNETSTSACGSEVEVVNAPSPQPTSISTSLSGGAWSGDEWNGWHDRDVVTTYSGNAVNDSATLSGANVSSASGTVTYTVYSDPWHGTVVATDNEAVVNGVVTDSVPVTLGPGIYSWQASYSGDALNQPSQSALGSEIEVVLPNVIHHPPPHRCGHFLRW